MPKEPDVLLYPFSLAFRPYGFHHSYNETSSLRFRSPSFPECMALTQSPGYFFPKLTWHWIMVWWIYYVQQQSWCFFESKCQKQKPIDLKKKKNVKTLPILSKYHQSKLSSNTSRFPVNNRMEEMYCIPNFFEKAKNNLRNLI